MGDVYLAEQESLDRKGGDQNAEEESLPTILVLWNGFTAKPKRWPSWITPNVVPLLCGGGKLMDSIM